MQKWLKPEESKKRLKAIFLPLFLVSNLNLIFNLFYLLGLIFLLSLFYVAELNLLSVYGGVSNMNRIKSQNAFSLFEKNVLLS